MRVIVIVKQSIELTATGARPLACPPVPEGKTGIPSSTCQNLGKPTMVDEPDLTRGDLFTDPVSWSL